MKAFKLITFVETGVILLISYLLVLIVLVFIFHK